MFVDMRFLMFCRINQLFRPEKRTPGGSAGDSSNLYKRKHKQKNY
jgi:hypothetical protein